MLKLIEAYEYQCRTTIILLSNADVGRWQDNILYLSHLHRVEADSTAESPGSLTLPVVSSGTEELCILPCYSSRTP